MVKYIELYLARFLCISTPHNKYNVTYDLRLVITEFLVNKEGIKK